MRPDTWQHRLASQHAQATLANGEPSTHGYRRNSGSVTADDGNAVVRGHRAGPARGNLRGLARASLARPAEPPLGDHRATGVGMGQIRLAAEAFSAARMHAVLHPGTG